MNENDNNVFSLVKGDKPVDNDTLPFNNYRIRDIDNKEYFSSGFLIFTSMHIAVMREGVQGAAPVLILPLTRLAVAEVIEDDGTNV